MRRTSSGSIAIVFLLFLFSGATSLVYQVLWLRMLILIFGSTLFATSAILSTFMGGLALGAMIAGRTMDRSPSPPLRVYGFLEIGIGLYALIVPLLFSALSPVYRAVWNHGGSDSLVLLSLAKFVGIAVVLIAPTTLMGASLPVLARDVADDPDRIGGKVGSLYAVNTFGAVFGTFLAGFVLLPAIGMRQTLWWTAAANIVIGIVAIVAARSRAAVRHEPESMAPGPRRWTRHTVVLLSIFAMSGFGAMVLEVAWTRALSLVLGSSVYAFSLMLVAFLIGLALGGAAFAALLRRYTRLHPGGLLAVLLVATGLFAYGTVFVFQHLPRLFGEIYFAWSPGPNGWFAVQFLFGLVVMFPATFAFGGIFPAVLQLHARGLDEVAGSVGTVYAANTAGTILGAAVAGFALIPGIGVQQSVVTVAVVQMLLGVAAWTVLAPAGGRRTRIWAVAMILVALGMPVMQPGWNALLMNSGVYMNLQDLPEGSGWEDFRRRALDEVVLVYAAEGMTASVLVADEPQYDNRFLAVNGKIEASTHADMETQLMCAHLPLLLHPDPKDVMVIGLASGITVGSAAAHPVESIRVVEVEEKMLPAAELFAEANGGIMQEPRVRFSINDARNELEFSSDSYDVIISEPSNPWMTVAANLFTEDFFRIARSRLRRGGMFAQWVQNYYLPTDDLRSIVAAFHEAFPYVHVFETFEGVDLVLLGSEEPIDLDLDLVDRRMSELLVRMDLARINVRRPTDVLPLFRLGHDEVGRFVEGAPRNTDDNARVEFSAPKALGLETLGVNIALISDFLGDPLDYVTPAPADRAETDRLRLDLARSWLKRGRADRAAALAEAALDGPLGPDAEALMSRYELR